MKTLDELWDEWTQQAFLLQAQQSDAFVVLKEMVYAVLQGEVSNPDEVDEILLELAAFADHYPPAKDLIQEICDPNKRLPILEESKIARAMIKVYEQ